jgi:hypothetical protein
MHRSGENMHPSMCEPVFLYVGERAAILHLRFVRLLGRRRPNDGAAGNFGARFAWQNKN